MAGYIDLHCHWIAGIDDGARNVRDSEDILRALVDLGFSKVIGTPHMRSGMFDNNKSEICAAYEKSRSELAPLNGLPHLGLACEHHLDDVAFSALMAGNGLPYPGGHAALIEFPNERFPLRHKQRMFELRQKKLRPVLAHPERYRPVWDDISALDGLLDGGTVLLLDVAALDGKYGRASKKCAIKLLEAGYYYAACSDSHSVRDAKAVANGIAKLHNLMGDEEALFLLQHGPSNILDGSVAD